ncbi:MAG TPA: hypothetical protein VM619_06360 [Luteimonas sp.]|nr:hypothetical protein [Luteimonas sp.]
MTGMMGVYLAAAELTRKGFIVSPTSRSAAGADLLLTDSDCLKAFSIQVKSDRTKSNFFLVGKKCRSAVSKTHVYVFVKFRSTKKAGESVHYYVVPSKKVAELAWHEGRFPSIRIDAIAKYENRWDIFGDPDPLNT